MMTFTVISALVGVIVIPVIVSVLTDDAKTFLPRFAQYLVRKAAMRLPEANRLDYCEEWLAHIEEIPEITGKLWHAISLYGWGSFRLRGALSPNERIWRYGRWKRALDIIYCVAALPLIFPIFLVIAVMTVWGRGPVLIGQPCVGMDGRVFRLLKFRTMKVGADKDLEEHLASNSEAAAEWRKPQMVRYDPRMTAVGRFLRKTNLDTLPHLLNILKGEMSIIGPRPMLPYQAEKYLDKDYLMQRPGFISPSSVSGQNFNNFAEMYEYDIDYLKNRFLLSDLKILWKAMIGEIWSDGK